MTDGAKDDQPAGREVNTLDDYRILSVDGGGIYGLVSALWLKTLCQSNPHFLVDIQLSPGPNVKHFFAGASAGAVTVLLMARDKDPRKALLSGEIEDFWKSSIGAFTNKLDPVEAWLSLWGIGGWTGERDFQHLLEKHFGDMTLKELHHPVVITVFDWTGEFKARDVNSAWPSPLFPGMTIPASRSQDHDAWKPRVITNVFHDDAHRDLPVKKVAYWAATPPGLRTIRNGLADAATFGANPALDALSVIFDLLHLGLQAPIPPQSITALQTKLSRLQTELGRAAESDAYQQIRQGLMEVQEDVQRLYQADSGVRLADIALLSVGNGTRFSSFWLQDFNLGSPALLFTPTNPYHQQWFPPDISVMLDAPMERTNELCTRLLRLHEGLMLTRYHRLNPGIMQIPVLVASLLSRWDAWRDYFVREIEANVRSPASTSALVKTERYLNRRWLEESGS